MSNEKKISISVIIYRIVLLLERVWLVEDGYFRHRDSDV